MRRHHDYAKQIKARLDEAYQIELDERNEKIGYKIREAKFKDTLYADCQDKEQNESTVSVGQKRAIGSKPLSEFIDEVDSRYLIINKFLNQ